MAVEDDHDFSIRYIGYELRNIVYLLKVLIVLIVALAILHFKFG
jgi:hypothetical protein